MCIYIFLIEKEIFFYKKEKKNTTNKKGCILRDHIRATAFIDYIEKSTLSFNLALMS